MSDKQYAEISRITGEIEPYMGRYIIERADAYGKGEVTAQAVIVDLRFVQRKFDVAIAELSAVRFPRFGQRVALGKFVGGLRDFSKAVAIIIDGLETDNDANLPNAGALMQRGTLAAGNYAEFMFKDRFKKARAVR